MGSHPINLTIRFILELAALLAMGVWGWNQTAGWGRYLLAFGIPILAAVLWGTFAVPDDPSRSGAAPVAIPGILRLLLELAIFGFAVWALYDAGFTLWSWGFGVVVILHYLTSYDRIAWLLSH